MDHESVLGKAAFSHTPCTFAKQHHKS